MRSERHGPKPSESHGIAKRDEALSGSHGPDDDGHGEDNDDGEDNRKRATAEAQKLESQIMMAS